MMKQYVYLLLALTVLAQAQAEPIAVRVESTTNALVEPSAANFASANGLVLTSLFGTGVATALGVNTGSAGAFVVLNGAGGTPSSLTLTSATGLPISTGVTGLGTGIATALAVNTGSAGAPVLFNGALGTPSSGTLTSATGLPISTGVSGLGTGIATALAVNTGSAGAPVLYNGAGGTPSAMTLTNATGLPPAGVTGTAAILGANTFTGAQTMSVNGAASAPAVVISGVPYTAGSATTNFPLVYLNETSSTASTTLNTSGTMFGINKNTAGGNYFDFMVDGVSKASMLHTGALTLAAGLDVTANNGGLVMRGTTPKITLNSYFTVQATAAGVATFSHDTTTSAMKIQVVPDQATVPIGSISGGNARAGTDTNTVGGDFYVDGGKGTGTGLGGTIQLRASVPTSTGTAAGTLTTRVTVRSDGVTLDDATSKQTDDTYTGRTLTGLNNSGGVTQWNPVYLNSSSQWVHADANGSGTYPARGLAVTTQSTGAAVTVIRSGTVRNDAWTWTPGGTVYLSTDPTTTTGLTQTAPSTTGDKVQVIGFALDADTLCVDISTDYGTAP